MQFSIGGTDYTDYVGAEPAYTYDDEMSARSTLSVAMVDVLGFQSPSPAMPQRGQHVKLYDPDGTQVFGGTIDSVTRLYPVADDGSEPAAVQVTLQCVDYSQLCDRKVVAVAYANASPSYIVNDLVSQGGLDVDGVTVDCPDTTTVIPTLLVNYQTVRDALNALCNLTGYGWWIDESLVLHVLSRSAVTAPWTITDAVPNCVSISVDDSRDNYRNRQFVLAGTGTTDPQTESFVGDTVLQTFVVKFPVATVPTITLNGTPQTVGVRQVDTGKQWYWNKGTNQISQDTAGTPIGASDTLVVTYTGQFPIVASGENDTAIAERQAVEGGTGIYDAVQNESQVNSVDLAILSVSALLALYPLLTTVTVVTNVPGARAGQLLTINRTREGLDDDYLVITVRAQDTGVGTWQYTITAVNSTAVGGWVQYYLGLAQAAQGAVDTTNVLLLVRTVTDGVACGDVLTVTSATPESRIGYGTIGFMEIG